MASRVAGDLSYRRGRAEDLGAVNAIFHEAQTESDAAPPPLSPNGLPIFPHEIAHSELWVATEAGAVVAFAATVERGGTAFLAELFVRRERRSNGIGAALLERCFDDRGLPRMTMSSPDPRALALYVSLGLEPRWPLFYLIGEPGRVLELPQFEIDVRLASAGDPTLRALDAAISGRDRPEDLKYWQADGAGSGILVARGPRDGAIGYAVIRHRSDDWVGNESAITIGPAGGITPHDAVAAVIAAVRAVRGTERRIRIGVPGPHPALRDLLALGFTIAELDTFCATPGALAFDPTRYLPSGGALF